MNAYDDTTGYDVISIDDVTVTTMTKQDTEQQQ